MPVSSTNLVVFCRSSTGPYSWGITRALGSGLRPFLNVGLRAPTQGLRAPTLGLRAPTLGLRALRFYVKIWDPLLFDA